MKTSSERAAYYKGKYDALKEKANNTGSMLKQSIIDHTVRYALIAIFVIGGSFGTYYYVSHKVTETVTEIRQDVKDSIPHPIEATKKWYTNKDHWWNKEDNKTEEVSVKKETEVIVIVEKEVSKTDDNLTLMQKAKGKWKSWFKKDDNTTKE